MEELNDKIARLLSSPDSMAKIQSMMAALGSADGAPTVQADVPQTAPAPAPTSAPAPVSSGAGMPDLSMLTKLMPLMGAFSKEDDDTRLLEALRPYLHGERAGRLDETMKLLRLTRLLPLLQEQGLLGGGQQGGTDNG